MRLLEKIKDKPWIKYLAAIVLSFAVVLIIGMFDNSTTENDTENTEAENSFSENARSSGQNETEKESLLQSVWDDSKGHLFIFGLLTIALIIVKIKKSVKLNERGKTRKETKK